MKAPFYSPLHQNLCKMFAINGQSVPPKKRRNNDHKGRWVKIQQLEQFPFSEVNDRYMRILSLTDVYTYALISYMICKNKDMKKLMFFLEDDAADDRSVLPK